MDNLPPKEIADEDMINQAFQQLLNDYLSTKHRKKVEIITKAFNFANQAHKGIKRRSGEPLHYAPDCRCKYCMQRNRFGLDLHLRSLIARCGRRYRLHR